MKTMFTVLFALLLSNAHCARLRTSSSLETVSEGQSVSASETVSTTSADDLITSLLSLESDVRFSHVVDAMSKQVDFKAAAAALKKHKLPHEVSSLIAKANGSSTLDDDSLQKARKFLNGLVESAYIELDAQIIAAKTFEARNRGSFEQVVADISRLGQQIAGHIGRIQTAQQCIKDCDLRIDAVRERLREEQNAYLDEYSKNEADMTIKQNDLDVFDFLIKTTKKMCDEQSFVQVGKEASVQMCQGKGTSTLRFSDASMQAKYDRLLMKGSRDLLRNTLAQTAKNAPNFLQESAVAGQPLTAATAQTPTISGQEDSIGALKCGPIPDCGLLYDTLSLEWGGYKDQVDELKKIMADNQAAWEKLKAEFNDQIETINAQKKQCGEDLSDATKKKNSDEQELAEKEGQKRNLDAEHKKEMATFKARIKYIFGQDICGPIVIRNQVMMEATTCAPKDIDDCDTTAWKPGECSVPCDDLCPIVNDGSFNFATCGGLRQLKRSPVVVPNECGIRCPALNETQSCNQHKCPVNCEMSKWSGWSKCSKECGGGMRGRTRGVVVKPMFGGDGCPPVSDSESCNDGDCDRDCLYADWTVWSPCSMACGGGDQQRTRPITRPIRANGKCPGDRNHLRFEEQLCNVQQCVGDEICIANQDLVINVDASGSVNAENWKLVVNFTGEMLKRYKAKYYGQEQVHIGVVLFGNGVIEDDGTISKAVLVSELTKDLAGVKTAVAAMEHQKGFTNLAQGFKLGQKLLQQRGRRDAQSAIMTISDGKPSFHWETGEVAKDLDAKGIMKFMVAVSEFPGSDEWQFMKSMATKPWPTNTVRVPGFSALADGAGNFVQEALTKFCPAAMSPSQTLREEKQRGFMLVYTKGYCGGLGRTLGSQIYDPQECFRLAQAAGRTGFSMGRKYRKGKCSVELLPFTCDEYAQWQANPDDPACSSSWTGGFHNSKYYDWYALEPNCED